MNTIMSTLTNPILGTLIGLLGLLTAFIFFLRSKRIPGLAYQYRETSIVGGSTSAFPKEVEVSYLGIPVRQITATRIILWNSGNTTILGSQIVQSDPFRIEVPENEKILKAYVLRETRSVNGFNFTVNPKNEATLLVNFDYLDPNDGITIEIIHSAARNRIQTNGTLRELPNGISNLGIIPAASNSFVTIELRNIRRSTIRVRVFKNLLSWVMGITGVGVIILGLASPVWLEQFVVIESDKNGTLKHFEWMMIVAGALYTILPLTQAWLARRKYPKKLDFSRNVTVRL